MESYCRNQGFELLSINFGHAERAGSWPQEHGDPFDRDVADEAACQLRKLIKRAELGASARADHIQSHFPDPDGIIT